MTLKNRVALVTGGGRGIGKAIATALANQGADVVVAARSVEQLKDTVSLIEDAGSRGFAIPVDLSQRTAIDAFVREVQSSVPGIDILVNNAGIGSGMSPNQIVAYDDEFWDTSLAVNLTAPYLLTKAFLPAMIERGQGRIINIASVLGKMGLVTAAAYSSTKHGLIGLTRTAALETATTGVTVNAICPGPIRTLMLEKRIRATADLLGDTVENVEKGMNPVQRLLETEEVADLAVYLAGDSARSITGQSYNVSGGMVMH